MQNLTVAGIKELKANIKLLTTQMQQQANKKGTKAAADIIRDEAEVKAPKGKTGKLSSSIKTKKQRSDLKWQQTYIVRPIKVYYWWFAENGTSKMSAKPFLRPAFETKKSEGVKAYEDEANKVINKWK